MASFVGLAADSAAQNNRSSEPIDEVKLLVEMNNRFALDLYRQLALGQEGENIFFSPYSVRSVLLMAAAGARGETAAQMGQALHFPAALRRSADTDSLPWDMAPLQAGMAALNAHLRPPTAAEDQARRKEVARLRAELKQLNEEVERTGQKTVRPYLRQQHVVDQLNRLLAQLDPYEIRVANALWCEETYPLRQDFLETIDKHDETGSAFPMDFKRHPEESRLRINAWVAEQTRQHITDLLQPGTVNALTRLVLTNAIFFKGEWLEPLEEWGTRERAFFLAGGDSVRTDVMDAYLSRGRYAAFEADGAWFDTPDTLPDDPAAAAKVVRYPGPGGFASLELPYKGDRLAMLLIAPNRPEGLPAVEALLNADVLQRWIQALKRREVHALVPKLRLQTSYSLAAPLQELGMVRAFKDPRFPGGAQFGGMTRAAAPNEQFQIAFVVHKALVEVDEKGTEAAAATGVAVFMGAAQRPSIPFVPLFHANRPFLFVIHERATGAILFVGRMQKPESI